MLNIVQVCDKFFVRGGRAETFSWDQTRSGDKGSKWRQGIFPRRIIDESSTRNEHQGPIIFPISTLSLLPVSSNQPKHKGTRGTPFQASVLLCRTGKSRQFLSKFSRWRPRIAQIATVKFKVRACGRLVEIRGSLSLFWGLWLTKLWEFQEGWCDADFQWEPCCLGLSARNYTFVNLRYLRDDHFLFKVSP